MSLPANISAKFASVPNTGAEAELLAHIGLTNGEATHIAAALLAIFAIKAIF